MIEYIVVGVAAFVAAYIVMELKPMKQISVNKALRIVDHRQLLLKIPEILRQHGWKYIVTPDEMEQNIRGLVISENRNKLDKRTGKYRYMVEYYPIDNPNKKEWEWVDFYDNMDNKLKNIIVANGTVIVPLTKRPNKYDYHEDIAWNLMPPDEVNYWYKEYKAAKSIKREYSYIKDRFEKLQDDYNRLNNRLKTVALMLRDRNRELNLKEEYIIELEGMLNRYKEAVNGLKNQLAVVQYNLEEIVKRARESGQDIIAEKMRKELDLIKDIFAKTPSPEEIKPEKPAEAETVT